MANSHFQQIWDPRLHFPPLAARPHPHKESGAANGHCTIGKTGPSIELIEQRMRYRIVTNNDLIISLNVVLVVQLSTSIVRKMVKL